MRVDGRRIHIAGSASATANPGLLRYAHDLVERLVQALAGRGARFVVGVGAEPPGPPDGPSIIFDWTALAAAHRCWRDGAAAAKGPQGRLVATVATTKTDRQIPAARKPLWEDLLAEDAVQLEFVPSGWTSGAVRRTRQAQLADLLVAVGGGEGVEHLAQLYAMAGKPIIALDLELGAGSGDGSGGAPRLAAETRAAPDRFLRLADPAAAGGLLAGLATRAGGRPVDEVVGGIVALIEALAPPGAFYVRLLNSSVKGFAAVERFFRNVVDPLVTELGYEPKEMGHNITGYAWMNEAIFDSLHYSSVVVVDLTGLRTNCFMELGYALGRVQKVIITARSGTRPPFDAAMLEHHAWTDSADNTRRMGKLREYWERNIDRGPLVRPRAIL